MTVTYSASDKEGVRACGAWLQAKNKEVETNSCALRAKDIGRRRLQLAFQNSAADGTTIGGAKRLERGDAVPQVRVSVARQLGAL